MGGLRYPAESGAAAGRSRSAQAEVLRKSVSDTIKNILPLCIEPGPAKTAKDSNRFPGHQARMAAHIRRIHEHRCDRTDGRRCSDCIKGKL